MQAQISSHLSYVPLSADSRCGPRAVPAQLHQQESGHFPLASTPAWTFRLRLVQPGLDMCWFTLSPSKSKKHRVHHSSDSSCAEDLVRVHRSPSRHHFTDIKVKLPSSVSLDMSEHHHHPHLHPHLHHHHRHHLHPLHMHPLHGHHHHQHHHHLERAVEKLHGHGRRRHSPPPGPPPPTRDASRCRTRPRSPAPAPAPCPPREPIYRTQIVEPREVRDMTRVALRGVQPERQRGRLRRVAGYEVLGSQVPFDWDCVSSTVGGSSAGGRWVRKKAKSSGLRYPPFGSVERWM
ncbi:hypothetical protein DE146DRAFT_604162 [Phaeosphaeria sp. MPI-PUGE-AT-0046c]|nr:hypothetical protein DE146DRAFT_604162 [Phaeosphaeria sp. MPI-PUGE-AT-0046c]